VRVNNHPRRVEMGWSRFLVLEELPSGQHKRIGVGRMDPERHGNWFEGIEPRELEIV